MCAWYLYVYRILCMKKKTIYPAFIILILAVLGLVYLNSKKDSPYTNIPQASVSLDTKDVASTKTVTQPSTKTSSTSSANRDVDGVVLVSYTGKGFVPFITEVDLGESVRFVNNRTDRALWVVSTHPEGTKEFYPGFSGSKSFKKGESFTVPFTKVGAWSYKNLNDASHQGVILVR